MKNVEGMKDVLYRQIYKVVLELMLYRFSFEWKDERTKHVQDGISKRQRVTRQPWIQLPMFSGTKNLRG